MTVDELADLLRALHARQDGLNAKRFDRHLPFADGLFDRWERARALGFGEDASIYDSSLVYGSVSVGEGTWIGPYTLLDGSGGGLALSEEQPVDDRLPVYGNGEGLPHFERVLTANPRALGAVLLREIREHASEGYVDVCRFGYREDP